MTSSGSAGPRENLVTVTFEAGDTTKSKHGDRQIKYRNKMVFESLVVDVLNRFLGDYVVNLDSSQLKLGIWGGKANYVLELWLAKLAT